jgi:hypothetical protein
MLPNLPGNQRPDARIRVGDKVFYSDTSVVQVQAKSYVNKAPGKAVEERCNIKNKKYAAACKALRASFHCVAIESYGGLSKDAIAHFKSVISAIAQQNHFSLSDRAILNHRLLELRPMHVDD